MARVTMNENQPGHDPAAAAARYSVDRVQEILENVQRALSAGRLRDAVAAMDGASLDLHAAAVSLRPCTDRPLIVYTPVESIR